jgi:hypothetical protein
MERFRIPTDPGISPLDAGESLQILATAGLAGPENEWFRPPVRLLEARFIPEGSKSAVGIVPQKWPIDLFPMAAAGFSPDAEAHLRQVALHAGLSEFETLGRAEALDVMGARFALPLPKDASAISLPIPRLNQVREAGLAMVARSVIQYLDGDFEGAELTLKTLISAGLVYGKDAPFLIDTLIGYVLVGYGADALIGLYEASGRTQQADALRWVREATQTMGKATRSSSFGDNASESLQRMPSRVLSETELRGIRWEYFMLLAGISPCINSHQIVFGPGMSQEDFMRSAKKELVRYPTEAAVWEVLGKGFFDLPEVRGLGGLAAKVTGATLGPRAGRCAAFLVASYF